MMGRCHHDNDDNPQQDAQRRFVVEICKGEFLEILFYGSYVYVYIYRIYIYRYSINTMGILNGMYIYIIYIYSGDSEWDI